MTRHDTVPAACHVGGHTAGLGPVVQGEAGVAEVSSFSSLGKEINNFFIGVLDSGFLPNVLKVTLAPSPQHVK